MKYLYVANWKMNLSFNNSLNFCANNSDALQQLSTNADIVICPSFIAIPPIIENLKNTDINIGAQNCSEYTSGAYTGEVAAESLAQVGVTYCLVGHSERRIYFGETTENIIKKTVLLQENSIQPIICIGETKEEFINKKTYSTLTQQLEPILKIMCTQKTQPIIIAYEPVWAIGTNSIPEETQLISIFAWLAELLQLQAPHLTTRLLYGGSVNRTNILQLRKIPHIGGFLIGSASTNFEEFQNIIIQQAKQGKKN